ncbi:MAG: thioesterase family protein [Oscillospiraceae bacterium]|nr:thioesterase family protein [Oscillospiraceae bacterium]
MKIGDSFEVRHTVVQADTAEALGSGGLAVLATPRLTALMENAAFTLLQDGLPEGKSSVGINLNVSHVSPTPVGMEIRVTAEITEIAENGKTVDFKVTGFDAAGLIGEGTHRRAVIDTQRFLAKCQSKLNS